MAVGRIKVGVSIQEPRVLSPIEMVERIVDADQLGVHAAWVATAGAWPDGVAVLAAAAQRTKQIQLGTAIVPTFPLHPLVLIAQATVLANLAPGRVVIGVGPSHQGFIEGSYGLPFNRPLEHLREYVTVVRTALREGHVRFEGARFKVRAHVPYPAPVPIMTSALRRNAFRLAGEVADGVISYMCPARYLREVAQPALQEGAARAGRPTPPLIAGVIVALTGNADEVIRVAHEHIGHHTHLPFYRAMLLAAGFSETELDDLDNRVIDALVIHGDEATVAAGLRSFAETAGASELNVGIMPVGADPQATFDRCLRLVANL